MQTLNTETKLCVCSRGYAMKQLKVVMGKVSSWNMDGGKREWVCVYVLRHTDRYAEAGGVPRGRGINRSAWDANLSLLRGLRRGPLFSFLYME